MYVLICCRRPERDSARSDALDSKPCWRDCGCPASPFPLRLLPPCNVLGTRASQLRIHPVMLRRPCAYRAHSEAAAVQNATQRDPTRLTASRVGEIVGVPLPRPASALPASALPGYRSPAAGRGKTARCYARCPPNASRIGRAIAKRLRTAMQR